MRADLAQVEPGSRFSIREAKREDWDSPRLLQGYFTSAAPGIGRDLEVSSIQGLFKRALDTPVLVGLLAEAVDGTFAALFLEEKAWDTRMLSVRVRNLTLVANAPSRLARREIGLHLITHCLQHYAGVLGDCIFTRIPSEDVALISALEEGGFHVLVPMVTLGKSLGSDAQEVLPTGIELGEVRQEEFEQVETISATAFRYGRFTADIRVPHDGVEKLHSIWARNCCLGSQADCVLVARDGHEVLGFIALKFQMAHDVRVGSIELIAISESSRGRGVGGALVRKGCKWLRRFTNYVVVRTELPNTPALRMYEAQGFRVLNGSFYLSRWQRTGHDGV